jgi:nucleotide-binding universal stress UspA family protein
MLIPTDGSEFGKAGVLQGLRISKVLGVKPHVIVPIDKNLIIQDDMEVPSKKEAEKIVKEVKAAAEAINLDAVVEAVEGDSEEVVLKMTKKDSAIDLVALGCKCRTDPEDVILGSLAESLVKELSIPVICQNYFGKDFLKKFNHMKDNLGIKSRHRIDVLVAMDASEQSRAVALIAVEFANQLNVRTRVTALHVAKSNKDGDGKELTKPEKYKDIVEYANELGVEYGVAVDPVVEVAKDVGKHIVRKAAELKADIIIMGTHGRTRLLENVLGSKAKTVLYSVSVPVMVIPPKLQKEMGVWLDFQESFHKIDSKIPSDIEEWKSD